MYIKKPLWDLSGMKWEWDEISFREILVEWSFARPNLRPGWIRRVRNLDQPHRKENGSAVAISRFFQTTSLPKHKKSVSFLPNVNFPVLLTG